MKEAVARTVARHRPVLLVAWAMSVHAHGAATECPSLGDLAGKRAVLANQQYNRSADPKHDHDLEVLVPLLQQTIGSSADLFSLEFASTLACWQGVHGLRADGQLTAKTRQALQNRWQSQRTLLGKATETPRSQLSVVPEPLRFRIGASPKSDAKLARQDAIDALVAMRAAARKNSALGTLMSASQHLSVVSAYRSSAQTRAIKQRTGADSTAIADRSVHMSGTAFDLYVGGERTSAIGTNRVHQVRDYPTYRWLLQNARTFGFVNYYYEPWHWEFVGA